MQEVKETQVVTEQQAEEQVKQPKQKIGKGRIFYKKVTVTVTANEQSVTLECMRLKGDEKLQVGEQISVRGELRRRNDVLEFSNGCTFVKLTEQSEVGLDVVTALQSLPEGEAYANGFCAIACVVSAIQPMPNEKPQKISLYIGALTMFVAAVLFMVMADLTFKNNAYDMIVAVLLSFSSAILFFLSANFGEKIKVMYVMKGLGIALGVLFVVYIHLYQGGFSLGHLAEPKKLLDFPGIIQDFENDEVGKAGALIASKATIIVTLVLGYVALAGQCLNTVLTAVIKED